MLLGKNVTVSQSTTLTATNFATRLWGLKNGVQHVAGTSCSVDVGLIKIVETKILCSDISTDKMLVKAPKLDD
jgi:hypothetical protein